jgi:predicted ArsR family transcriptional regulator
MLNRLLRIICSGGTLSLKQVAQQLDVSEVLVESMIDELVRMGYLRPLEGICIDHCNGCPMAGTCSLAGSGRVWALTEAGIKIVQSGAS